MSSTRQGGRNGLAKRAAALAIRVVWAVVVLSAVAPRASFGEAVFDGTLGPNPAGTTRAGDFTIDEADGETRGPNVFHSLLRLDVNADESATITAGSSIRNAIIRVTGDAAAGNDGSDFAGPLRASAGLNLHILNPMGLLFAPGAQVDVSGSVFLTTADGLSFDDGATFRVDAPTPTLSAGDPSAYAFDPGASGSIVFQGGPGSGSTFFELGPDADVTLLASDVAIRSAVLLSEAGTIRIAATGSEGASVPLDVASWTPTGGSGEVEVSGLSVVCMDSALCFNGSPDGPDRGRIVIRSGRFELGESRLAAAGDGLDPLAIDIEVADEVDLRGDFSEINASGLGANPVGGIRIAGGRIALADTASGITLTSGRSAAPVRLEADSITIDDADVETFASGDGEGANIELVARTVSIGNRSVVRTVSQETASGDAGSVVVGASDAETVSLSGASVLGTSTLGSGGAGRIVDDRRLGVSITARELSVREGAQITTTTSAEGDAGNLEIHLTGDAIIEGRADLSGTLVPSGLFARSGLEIGSDASGRGGLIDVDARSLTLADGAEISVQANGTGDAGAIDIDVEQTLRIDGFGTQVNARGTDGNGGDVRLSARDLIISNGAEVASEALLAGNAGFISMFADRSLDVAGGLVLSRLRQAGSNAGGGGILLDAGSSMRIRDGALVSSEGASIQDAGRIDLRSGGEIRIESGGSVTAAATNLGNAGVIAVEAARFVADDGTLETDSTVSSGGQIDITADDLLELRRSRVETSVQLSGDGSGGDVTLLGEGVVIDASEVIADARAGPGGNILISGDGVLISGDSVLSASSDLDIDGLIQVRSPDTNLIERLATLPESVLTTQSELAGRCAARDPARASSFIVGERDATPPSPDRWLAPTPFRLGASRTTDGALASALRRGDLVAALERLRAEAETPAEPRARIARTLLEADLLVALGATRDAERSRADALGEAEAAGEAALAAVARADLANTFLPKPVDAEALEAMRGFASEPQADETVALRARVGHRLGNALLSAGAFEAARIAFDRAASDAEAASDPLAAARSLAVAARASLALAEIDPATDRLERASRWLREAATSTSLAETRIHLGESWRRIGRAAPHAATHAFAQLTAAKEEAETAGDAPTAASAWHALARLYEDEGRSAEALDLARVAATRAARSRADDRLVAIEWQIARLLDADGDATAALDAYARAIERVEALRFEAAPPGRRYREDVAAIYYDAVDALLRADATAKAGPTDALLRRARDTIEASKASELRDFFEDACVDALAARTRSLDEVAGAALVVYPVPLDDRLELLVTRPGGVLERVTVPVDATTLDAETRRLRERLTKRTTRQYRAHARRLYDWLVRPLEPMWRDADVETIVFVPDGSLRTIPFGALFDGDAFLIERKAVAVAPSIALTEPSAIPIGDVRVLLGGLSEGRDGFSALPHVERELEALEAQLGGDVLVNDAFAIPRIEAAIRGNEYGVIHLATHAEFGASRGESFLLTHDGRLGVAQLESLVERFRFRDRPLELLGLSACETAAGDDQAALGLSGIAISAGARSVLGTLWSVNDAASSELVARFYQELVGGVSRAEALRRAQRSILERSETDHPYYWSPFILINSWL